MLQSFDDITDPAAARPRVLRLREEMARQGLDGFIVPRADEHQGEYVPASAARLRFITGFSGSAGTAVVLADKAAVFTDGRYTVQVREQVDAAIFALQQVPEAKVSTWITAHAGPGARIGYDPKLHTMAEAKSLAAALTAAGMALVAVARNPLDAIWTDRPAPPVGAVTPHPDELAGETAAMKLDAIREALATTAEDAVVLTNADSIAWLLNIRGADVPHTPFALSFAIVPREGRPTLYIDPAKVGDNVRGALAAVTEFAAPAALGSGLAGLGAARAKVRLDPGSAPRWFADQLEAAGAVVSEGEDPCILPKARKNAAEIAGARAAHVRDAAAVCRFLAWLDRMSPSGTLDEIGAAEQLEAFRRETGALVDLSFETISAAGPHAAMPHYRVSRTSNIPIPPNSLFLIDSGGQYRDGTTDITRTVAIGEPSEEMRIRFTLVLRGMIAISMTRFPKGTRGSEIDAFARRALWQAGLDYDHGTGHGVGSFLSVHEGPQRIAKTGTTPLEPGMILSNEPGYYQEGGYGIRIENLQLVTEPTIPEGGERPMLGFETLTFAPIDTRLVVPTLLKRDEIAWLNDYHRQVAAVVGPALSREDRIWLKIATQRVKR